MTENCVICNIPGKDFGKRTDYNRYDSSDPSGVSYGVRKVYEYSKCPNCGLWWTKNVDEDYDKLYESEKYWFEHHKRMGWPVLTDKERIDNDIKYSKLRIPEIRKYCPYGASAIEIGSSTGTMLKELKDNNFIYVIGVEPNDKVANIAAKYSRCAVIKNLNHGKPYSEGVSLVIALDVLEHIRNPLEECRKWVDNLQKGGILFLELPDAGCEHSINAGVDWSYVMHEHVYYYSKKNVIDLFVKLGCDPVWDENWLTTDRQRVILQRK